MNELFTIDNFNISINNLLKKSNSAGVDGIYTGQFKTYFEDNKDKIINSLLDGTYKPDLVEEVIVNKENGKDRTIYKYTCTDRVILDILKRYLTPILDPLFSRYSYAYRDNKGTLEAVKLASKYIEEDKDWVLEIDIKDFFDSINIQRLESFLSKEIKDIDVLKLIHKYLNPFIKVGESKIRKTIGIVQGSPISPLLSNLYMKDFDSYLESKYSFIRYSDNINIYFETYIEAQNALLDVDDYLRNKLGLTTNTKKSGIFESIKRRYLGYQFYRNNNQVYIKQYKKEPIRYHKQWYTSAITKIDKSYHLINDGILTKKDYTILFENEEKKYYIPIETCGLINIFSNVTFTSSFFELMNNKKLNVNIYNKYGKYLGSFNTSTHYKSNKTLLKQVSLYNNPSKRLILAKKIEIASIHNQRENLRYYYKHNKINVLDEAIKYISNCIDEINKSKTIEELMLIEARSKQKYLQMLDVVIDNEEFKFDKRTKRPPLNELNAMISFGNTLLYQRIASEIHRTSLDIRVGIVHSTNSRKETLNLDIAEIFKPIIVDKVIFSLIHNNQIHKDEHFEYISSNKGIYLNKEGKTIFIEGLEKKLYSKIKVEGHSYTYDSLIRREIRKLEKYIEDDTVKYKPYRYEY